VALAERIQKTQNYCIPFVYDVRWDVHITPYYVSLNNLKLADLRSIKILTLMHSFLNLKIPNYFSSFEFVSEGSTRSTRTGSTVLRMPHHRTTAYDRSFKVTACHLWNTLPISISTIESRPRFIASLRTYYMERMAASVLR